MGKNAQFMAEYTAKNYGVPLCADCAMKRAEQSKAEQQTPEVEAAE
jgi:hypothetical protein